MTTILSPKEKEALRFIKNFLIHYRRSPSVREVGKALGYKAYNTASFVLNNLISKGFLKRGDSNQLKLIKNFDEDVVNANTIDVPVIGSVACGAPILAQENIETTYPVSLVLAKPPHRYFFLRANGDSMDRAGIDDGDLVLIRQADTADNGEKVVALIDNEATIKILKRTNGAVILLPKSSKNKYKPIILNEDFKIQGIVVKSFSEKNI